MNERTVQDFLLDLVREQGYESHSFDYAGIMTSNKGIVIHMEDGTEFQVTVVQSR